MAHKRRFSNRIKWDTYREWHQNHRYPRDQILRVNVFIRKLQTPAIAKADIKRLFFFSLRPRLWDDDDRSPTFKASPVTLPIKKIFEQKQKIIANPVSNLMVNYDANYRRFYSLDQNHVSFRGFFRCLLLMNKKNLHPMCEHCR